MRLGFFGGTFDPPHRGHLAIARAAADGFGLDQVLWAPAGRQPLKGDRRAALFTDRLAMVKLTCLDDRRFWASELDAPKVDGTANFTVDTLRRLRELYPDDEIFCVAGADSFADMGRWREPAALLRLAEWVVVSRPGFALGNPAGISLDARQRGRIHFVGDVCEVASATALRARLRAGDACRDVLLPAVADYVQTHGLYR